MGLKSIPRVITQHDSGELVHTMTQEETADPSQEWQDFAIIYQQQPREHVQ